MRLCIFSSNLCNLTCPYCAVAVNKFDASALSFADVRRGIDFFMERFPTRENKVIFLGGEPFMYLEELKRAIAHIASRRPGGLPGVDVFTNGTLMTPKGVAELEDLGADIYLSLDGRKDVNDSHRYFHKRPGSVFDKVMLNLSRVRWHNKRVNSVVHADSVESLVGNVHLFYKLGFKEINFQPDLYEFWTDGGLAKLRASLRQFGHYYQRVLDAERDVFIVPIIHFILERLVKRPTERRWWREPEDVVLGRDRRFYPCPTASTFHPKDVRAYRIGHVRSGIRWPLWRRFKQRVVRYIEKRGYEYADFYHTPEEMFLYGEAGPHGVDAVFDNENRVSQAFKDEFGRLALRLERHKRFREIYLDRTYSWEELAGAGA